MLLRLVSCGCALASLMGSAVQAAPPVGAAMPWESQADGDQLATVQREHRLLTQQVQAEVDQTIFLARAMLGENPAAVEQSLKLLLERVTRTPQLNAQTRQTLRGKLESLLREAHHRAETKDLAAATAAEARAAAADQHRVVEAIARDQERMRQLMDRFTSLMDEGRHAEAERMAAADISPLTSNRSVATTAAHVARQVGAAVDNLAQRTRRQQAVVHALAPVETSLTSFADDLPIVFPDAATWESLSLRRKNATPVDLKRLSPAEEKIQDALAETASWELVEMPLADAIDYLKDLYGVEIQLDSKALRDEGVGEELAITSRIKGISLRSALRSLLRPLELTYIDQDESILITTASEAANRVVTRAYPVADLVVPIITRQAGPMLGRGNSTGSSNSSGLPGLNPGGNNFGVPGGAPGGGPGMGGPL